VTVRELTKYSQDNVQFAEIEDRHDEESALMTVVELVLDFGAASALLA